MKQVYCDRRPPLEYLEVKECDDLQRSSPKPAANLEHVHLRPYAVEA